MNNLCIVFVSGYFVLATEGTAKKPPKEEKKKEKPIKIKKEEKKAEPEPKPKPKPKKPPTPEKTDPYFAMETENLNVSWNGLLIFAKETS